MSTENTAKLSLPYLLMQQAEKEVTHNEALDILDFFAASTFISILNSPPSSPANGDTYVIGDTPSDLWAGNAKKIAYYNENKWLFITPFEGLKLVKTSGEKTEYIYDSGLWKEYSSGTGGTTTETATGNSIINYSGSVKSLEVHLPVRSGDTQLPVMRFKLGGIGRTLGNANYNASGYVRVTVQAGDILTSSDFLISKTGASHRIDYQKYLFGGSSSAIDYYADSRGSKVLPQNALSSPGFLAWANNASVSSVAAHNHINGGLTWQGIPYSGMTDYQLGSPYAHHHTITELSPDGAHTHTVAVTAAYKISGSDGSKYHDNSIDNHIELGTASSPLFSPSFYTSNGSLFSNYYTKQDSDFIEMRLNNVSFDRAKTVQVTVEFLGCKQKVWLYDGESKTWASEPLIAMLGDSMIEQVDFNASVTSPGGAYGSTYRWISSDMLDADNYGIGGQRTDQINSRLTLSGNSLSIDGVTSGHSLFVIDGGVNDCIRKVMYDAGVKFAAESYDASWTFDPVANITNIVSKLRSSGKKVAFLVCPKINANLYTSKVAMQAVTDLAGNNTTTMNPALWTTIASLWDDTKNSIEAYCKDNDIPMVDWYTPIENQGTYRSDLSYDGIHLNYRGYSILTSLMYDVIYSTIGNGSSKIIIDMKGAKGKDGDKGETGAQGPQGVKGDQGDPLTINAVDTLANKPNYDAQAQGFIFLAYDVSQLYIRLGTSGWSPAIPFVNSVTRHIDGGRADSVYTANQIISGGNA